MTDYPDLAVTFTEDADGYLTDRDGSPDSYGTEDTPRTEDQ